MKKRGFTLIELMVVIVIIGILAAIAIPKLFGMTAKAKASEVGPAAGTWSKLSQTYVQETSSLGTWTQVGYKAPGEGKNGTTSPNGKTSYLTYIESSSAGAWGAFNHAALGDCQIQTANNWTATINLNGAVTATNAPGACGVLTPNFDKMQ